MGNKILISSGLKFQLIKKIKCHLKWIILLGIVLILGIWVAADTLSNLSYEIILSRPSETIDFNENLLLDSFANNEALTEPLTEAEIDSGDLFER